MPDWSQSIPDGDHRWMMGVRPEDAVQKFFTAHDNSGAMLKERRKWLDESPEIYVALQPEADAALHETWELARAWECGSALEPPTPSEILLTLGRIWEPDIVWMHPDSNGTYRVAGGVVCFPSTWALREKLGRMMAEVHAPVPALNAELGRQIDIFLQRMTPGAVWRRENWSLSRDGELNHHPSRQRPRLDATITAQEVWLRLEHQLLMKLPRSGSVLFGIRIEVVPVSEFMRDVEATARLVRLVATMSEEAAAYKGLAMARDALLGILQGVS
jgi:hypothetical protein